MTITVDADGAVTGGEIIPSIRIEAPLRRCAGTMRLSSAPCKRTPCFGKAKPSSPLGGISLRFVLVRVFAPIYVANRFHDEIADAQLRLRFAEPYDDQFSTCRAGFGKPDVIGRVREKLTVSAERAVDGLTRDFWPYEVDGPLTPHIQRTLHLGSK